MDRPIPHPRLAGRGRNVLFVAATAAFISACSGAASPSVGTTAAVAPNGPAAGIALIAPAGGTSGSAGSGGSTSAGAPSVAYPYPIFGGSAGLAPDHELVVSGTGWATVKTDQSDLAAAQRTALAAAMTDAKSQAEAAAGDAGVTLGGVVSLSVSVGGNYIGVMSTGVASPPVPVNLPGAVTAVPPVSNQSAPSEPTTEQLEVTVTVAYGIS